MWTPLWMSVCSLKYLTVWAVCFERVLTVHALSRESIGYVHKCSFELPVERVVGFAASGGQPVKIQMAGGLSFSWCLTDLPAIGVSDVHRIADALSRMPRSKRDKGFKMYISSYIHNYEGKYLIAASRLAALSTS